MAQTDQKNVQIQSKNLKIPKITSALGDSNALRINFVFVKQAVQSIDNKNNATGGHAGHKHGDEVVTIRKELQFHEIETQIKYKNNNNNDDNNDDNDNNINNDNNKWISLGGFRLIYLLEKPHCHHHNNHNHNHCPDTIRLCYPSMEINQYLISHQLKWINGNNFEIRMRLRYKIAYRVAHLAQQVDSIVSNFSTLYPITATTHKPLIISLNQNNIIDNDNDVNMSDNKDNTDNKTDIKSSVICVSLCSDKSIQFDNLTNNSRNQLLFNNKLSNYPNSWLFYPSLTVGAISQNVLSAFKPVSNSLISGNNLNSNTKQSVLFCYDGVNKDTHIVTCCYAADLSNGLWYELPAVNKPRSRVGLLYVPNCELLLLLGGYQYNSKDGTQYLKSMEYLNLSSNNNNKWITGAPMRTKRCEHSIGLISTSSSSSLNNNSDMVMICGGSNNMFLRSSTMLTVTKDVDDNISFQYKRLGLMKEACIKGSICYDNIDNTNNNHLYIIGGNNGFGSTRNAQYFDIIKNKWLMIKGTLYEHDDYPAVWIENNTMSSYYGMIGVIGHSQQLSCVEYYDKRINEWILDCQYPHIEPSNSTANTNNPSPKMHFSRMTSWYLSPKN